MALLARAIAILAPLLALGLAAPAAAHDGSEPDPRLDPARIASLPGVTTSAVGLMSDNVKHLTNSPDALGISGCFSKSAPYFYLSGLDTISVFDASDPANPQLVGVLDNIVFENEAMNCGERRTKDGVERFVLVGNNLYDYSSSDPEGSAGSTLKDELIVVDVTDPTKPHIRSRLETTTGDHTVACILETACDYAYSSGGNNGYSIVDLRDLDAPQELDGDPLADGVQPFSNATGGHKWNFAAGYGIHTGRTGTKILDVTDPREPKVLATSGEAGRGKNPDGSANGYNDFIHHNSFWPNAESFVAGVEPSLENGNVLLVTEEDYEDVNCATAGSFQAWHVQSLPGGDAGEGTIVPLDKVELADLGTYPLPVGAFCSSHWFDYHQSGIAAVAFYGGGTQFIDVRDPENLTSFGHAIWGVSEVWDTYWVPVYNKKGIATGKRSNIAYSVDLVRGLDVYQVDLPKSRTSPSEGGVLDQVTSVNLQASGGVVVLGLLVAMGLHRLQRRRS
ncbi:MAG: hypothetical protein Q8Q02_02040 [Nocardioides sp.]|nr:hypothetical protein [Nocardioides sp.]